MRFVSQSFYFFLLFLPFFVSSSPKNQKPLSHYKLTVDYKTVERAGKKKKAMVINNSLPAPTLYFKEGDRVVVEVENKMDKETSIHWHGILLPNFEDGVPYLTSPPIKPGSRHKFEWTLRQPPGTYWYHSHTGLQEQEGLYGAIVIEPKKKQINYNRDLVLVLSDWTHENPDEVLRSLKRGSEWHSIKKGTLISFFDVLKKGALGAQLSLWRDRMPGMDISDIYYPAFLANGKREQNYPQFKAGDKVRLRLINASASTYFWLSFGGRDPLLVSADGVNVQPVRVNKLLHAVAETYDFLLKIPEGRSVEFKAFAQDGSGQATVFIGKGPALKAPNIPPPDLIEGMKAMAKSHHHSTSHQHNGGQGPSPQHSGKPDHNPSPSHQHSGKPDHNPSPSHQPSGKLDHNPSPSHQHSGKPNHSSGASSKRANKSHHLKGHKTDYRHSPSHKKTKHNNPHPKGHKTKALGKHNNSPNQKAHSSISPAEHYSHLKTHSPKALSKHYSHLKALKKTSFSKKAPVREITMNLTGNMWRYVWSINGKVLSEVDKIKIHRGEIMRITLNNQTMMHHPMHLHGHFFRVLNQNGEYSPLKHTVDVPPMSKVIIEFNANEKGDWLFHCHILYHMKSGMTRVLSYGDKRDSRLKNYPISQALTGDRQWFKWAEMSLMSHRADLEISLSNTRNKIDLEGTVSWVDKNYKISKDFEIEFNYQHFVGDFFRLYGGLNIGNKKKGFFKKREFAKLDFENKAPMVLLKETEFSGKLGLKYLLPYFVDLDLSIDHKGHFQVGLEYELMLLSRLAFLAEWEGAVNMLPISWDDKWSGIKIQPVIARKKSQTSLGEIEYEWSLGLEYIMDQNFSLIGSYDNRFGWGAGLHLRI